MRFSGRGIAPGRGEGVGLVDSRPVSFVGGVDRESGLVVDPASDLKGETVAGRVLVFPHGKGSTVGSYVLYGLAKPCHGPVAVVNERAEAIVATGAILGGARDPPRAPRRVLPDRNGPSPRRCVRRPSFPVRRPRSQGCARLGKRGRSVYSPWTPRGLPRRPPPRGRGGVRLGVAYGLGS